MFSRFKHHNQPQDEQLFAPDGRDLSDTTSPDYDPATDPELRLRVTHTASESIHQISKEEDRRRLKRLLSRKATPKSPRKSLFSRNTLRRRGSDTSASGTGTREGKKSREGNEGAGDGLAYEPRSQLERQRTQAAAEAEEAARRQEKQDGKKAWRSKSKVSSSGAHAEQDEKGKGKGKGESGERRTVFVNEEGAATDPKGYKRNKVQTSKYTLLTFLPKNLAEQFRRVANIYFLLLVVLQVFSIFGAAAPQVAMLPLLAILTITGVKDGVEDFRRHSLDNGVNNSAVTRLGDWKNVNQPMASRPWWDIFGLTTTRRPGAVSKGVKKLREKEGQYDSRFLYQQQPDSSNTSAFALNGSGISLDKDPSLSVHDYPPSPSRPRSLTLDSIPNNSSIVSGRTNRSEVVSFTHPTPGTAKWERTLWKKLEVGDIVLLKEDDQIPADIVVLSTSDPEGVCFIETKNLDGETNLKPRRALRATMGIANEEDIEHARFSIDAEEPHANLYSFNGVLKYRKAEDSFGREHPVVEGREFRNAEERVEPVTISELLLRGCTLRNTQFVIGLVLFTGADTKIMMNQGATPSKRSKIEKETNFNVIVNFVVLMGLCIACAIADGVWAGTTNTSAVLYEPGGQPSGSAIVDALVTAGSSLILFQNVVPISLVITVELVKTIQAYFIYQDLEMYYEPLDQPCLPKTWNISDDLGQIEYIFSDKTGTLTQNIMDFQRATVGGIAYGEGVTEAMLGAAIRQGRESLDPSQTSDHLADQKDIMIDTMRKAFKNPYLQAERLTLISPTLAKDLTTRSPQQRQLVEFWRALTICHTVLADRSDPKRPNHIEYKAESPDEAALVAAARDIGFVFLNRTNACIEIEVLGQPERWTPLRVLEFNSARKRMSTIVRGSDGRILLITKGADSVIYKRLAADHDPEVIASTTRHLEDFSEAGLRTLVISARYLSETEFLKWVKTYDSACAAVEEREEEIEKACDLIERDLTILGATALEDKLQVGVPEAIAQLRQAGIKLWILTGDKLQTAIEIGFSCNLLSSKMELMILSAESQEGVRAQIEAGLTKISRELSGLGPLANEKATKQGGFAVVIDGETLRFALEESLKPMFLELTTQCESVVCCRVSPSQKALTVKLVKDGKRAMTLAIGDGANDVAMIQEAAIGVGISGLEGAQASMSADYAIGQFRYLTRLVLTHGRFCYIRISFMHALFFYKNIVWTLTLFFFQIYCNFDATYLYDYSLIMLFNLVFTSLPVAALGIFDSDVSFSAAQDVPQLYRRGIQGLEYTRTIFFAFMLDGLYQSVISFYVPYLVYAYSTSLSVKGHDFSLWELGTTIAVCAVTAANLHVALHIRHWTWIVFAVIIGSTLSVHVWIIIYSQFNVFTFQHEVNYLYSTANFYTSVVLVTVACLLPKYLYNYVQVTFFPHDADIVRELEQRAKGQRVTKDLERQRHPEDLPLVATPIPLSPTFQSTLQNRSLPPGFKSFDDSPSEQPNRGLSPSSAQWAVPTIEVHGASPRGSVGSQYVDAESPSQLAYEDSVPGRDQPHSASSNGDDSYYDVGQHFDHGPNQGGYAVAM